MPQCIWKHTQWWHSVIYITLGGIQTIEPSKAAEASVVNWHCSRRGDRHSRKAHTLELDLVLQDQKEDGTSLPCQQIIRILRKFLKPSCANTDPQTQSSRIRTWWWDYSLPKLRERFWAPQADPALGKMLSTRVRCRKLGANPWWAEDLKLCELRLSSLSYPLDPLNKQSTKVISITLPGGPTCTIRRHFYPVFLPNHSSCMDCK